MIKCFCYTNKGIYIMEPHFAEDYSVVMGLMDLLPVILFTLAGCIIIKVMFNELRKPFAVLLCSGVTLSVTAGLFKAVWKILLALNICDFYPFDVMFMPTQALGFILMGVGLISILFQKKESKTIANVATWPLVLLVVLERVAAQQVDGNIAFIAMLVIGDLMIATSLCYLAVKNKNWICLVLFIITCVGLIVMGAMKPLSSKMNMSVTVANWVEESINIVAQGALLAGCYLMNKKGFFSYRESKE